MPRSATAPCCAAPAAIPRRWRAPAGRCCGSRSLFALAGLFGMLSGLALVGLTTSADANIALRYTLLSIAGVILGGGEFTGGRVSPIGAVIGALTLTLAGSLPVLPAHPARLADRRAGRDPDPRAGAARLLINRAEAARMTAAVAPAASPGSGPSSPPRWPSPPPSPSPTAGRGPDPDRGAVLRHLLRDRRPRPDVRDHARPGQCRPVDPATMTLAGALSLKVMDGTAGSARRARWRRSASGRSAPAAQLRA